MSTKTAILFIISFVFWMFISLHDLISYSFIEMDMVFGIIKSFWFPIIIPLSFTVPIIIAVIHIKRGYMEYDDIWMKFKKLCLALVIMCAFFMLSFAFIQGSILIANRKIGTQKDLFVKSTVAESKTTINRGRENYYIKIYSDELNRELKLKSKRKYYIGEKFESAIKLGSFNIAYKK